MAKSAGGKSRKIGRNKVSCALYRSLGRQERNKKRNIATEARRVAFFKERNAVMEIEGIGKSEARRWLRHGMW